MGEGSMGRRNLTDAAVHTGGVVATARQQGCIEQLEKPSSSRARNRAEQLGPITGDTGKWAEGERVADGPVVAVKPGNAGGAKRSNC